MNLSVYFQMIKVFPQPKVVLSHFVFLLHNFILPATELGSQLRNHWSKSQRLHSPCTSLANLACLGVVWQPGQGCRLIWKPAPIFSGRLGRGTAFLHPSNRLACVNSKITAMLTLACRNTSPARVVILSRWCRSSSIRHQSTVPKEVAGPFTTNSKISSGSRPEDKTLVYLGTIFSKNSTQPQAAFNNQY